MQMVSKYKIVVIEIAHNEIADSVLSVANRLRDLHSVGPRFSTRHPCAKEHLRLVKIYLGRSSPARVNLTFDPPIAHLTRDTIWRT